VIKFVSDLQRVSGFLQVLRFPPTMKTDCHNLTEILLKVALNTIIPLFIQSNILWLNNIVMDLSSLLSSTCCQNGFHAITFVVVDRSF
jgi:hypothetical protein